LAPYMMTLCN